MSVFKRLYMKNPRVTFSKGDESKKRVLEASLALFSEQGYEKTTMRQIIAKSGVLNGSVYYAFKNKDGIYEYIFDLMLDRVYGEIEGEEMDILTLLMYPAAIELHAVSSNTMLAEMLHHAHRSWKITNNLVDRYYRYIEDYYRAKNLPMDADSMHRFCLSLCGVIGVFADEEYLDRKGTPLEVNLRFVANYIRAVLNLPMVDADSVISAVIGKVAARKSILEDLRF